MSDTCAMVAGTDEVTVRRIGDVTIASLDGRQAAADLHQVMMAGGHVKLAFANSHVVNLAAVDTAFADALRSCLVLPDGIGVDIGSRLLYGAPFAANLNGTDFIPFLLATAPHPLSVGFIGARPGVAERALETLAGMNPQHRFRVFAHGFFRPEDEPSLLADIAAARPDLLLVAFGNPRQERWLAEKLGREHASVAAGVGALLDFLAGEVVRAPAVVRRLRLEWVFRLAQEPARLWRRYVLGNPAFLMRMLRQKWHGSP